MPADFVQRSDQSPKAGPSQTRNGWLGRLGIERVWMNGPLLLAASSLFWSGNFVVGRAVQGAITPVELSFWRWLAALAVLAWFAARHLRRDIEALRRDCVRVLVLAALGIAAMNTLFYRGLQSTTAVNALLLQSVAPLLVLSCTMALYGERPRRRQVVAILVSMLGVAAIAAHGDVALAWRGFGLRAGDLWIVAGTLCYAGYTTVLRNRPAVHATSLLAASMAAGVLLLLPFVMFQYFVERPAEPSGQLVLAVAYLAVLPSVLAFLCLNRGVELLGADTAGHYVHLMPAFGSALAVLFLGERLHLYHVAGAALIACGLLMARGAAPGWLSRVWDRIRICAERDEQRQALRRVDPQTLRDLGPGRVSHEMDKPFWHD